MNERIKPILVSPRDSIRSVMRQITGVASQNAPTGIALVVDEDRKLLGVATDGDFRRALVNDQDIDSPVEGVMVRNPVTVPRGLSEMKILTEVVSQVKSSGRIRDSKVNQVIVVDDQGRVDDVINFFEIWNALDAKNREVCVLGMGFVGLTLGVSLCDVGFRVKGYEVREDLVNTLNDGQAPFYEKGLASFLRFHVDKKNLTVSTQLEDCRADVYIITVGTPVGDDNQPNLEYLRSAVKSIGGVLKKKDLVILRSTVPVGTTRKVAIPALEEASGLRVGEEFFLSFAPERTVEGNALEELKSLPQVVGGYDKRSQDVTANFFSHLNKTIVRVESLESAEMVKLVNNCYRDVNFAFANELALYCHHWDLDVHRVIEAANEGYARSRVPYPSPGVGGACLRKDPYLYRYSNENDVPGISLSEAGRAVNEYMPRLVFEKAKSFCEKQGKRNPKVFIVGFAFKGEPETSDMRDSPTLDLVKHIQSDSSWTLYGYDPVVKRDELTALSIQGVSLREGFQDADCVIVMNNHRSYRDMDILGLAQQMNHPGLILDCWNLFSRREIEGVDGVHYGGLSGIH